MPWNFRSFASGAGFVVIPNEGLRIWPGISASDGVKSFVLAEMSCGRVIITVAGDPKA